MILKEEEFFTFNALSRPAMILGVPIKLFIIAGFIEFPILLLLLIFGKFSIAIIWIVLMIPIYFCIKHLSTKDENIVDVIVIKTKYYVLKKLNKKNYNFKIEKNIDDYQRFFEKIKNFTTN